jgi:hypothetical protein
LFILGVAFVLFKVSHQVSVVSQYSEREMNVPESLESVMAAYGWETHMGIETENPLAPTIEAFAISQDEGDF